MTEVREQCIFVETSLCTNLAMMLHHDDDLCVLKEKISKAHLECFPYFGDISISTFKAKRKTQYYHLSASITSNLYHFIGDLDKHIFVDVVSGEERVKIPTKIAYSSKKRKISKTDPNQSVVKVESIAVLQPEAKDTEKVVKNEGSGDLVMVDEDEELAPALKIVDDLIENHNKDQLMHDLENASVEKVPETLPEALPNVNKSDVKETGEKEAAGGNKSEKPRKKKVSSKTKA